MITIIHGNDIESSRNFYFAEKNKLQNPVFISGDGITFDQIFQTAENKTFFEEKIVILIENFFSKNKTNNAEFKKIISYLDSNKTIDVIFWEDDEISKTSLNPFKNATVKVFSYPQGLFTFLDNIKPRNGQNLIKLFHQLLKTMAPELVFFMITRQLRIMLSLGNGEMQIDEVKRLAPWQLSKFRSQAAAFGKAKLLATYNQLFEIEINQKTGKVPYSMEKSIDFFLLCL